MAILPTLTRVLTSPIGRTKHVTFTIHDRLDTVPDRVVRSALSSEELRRRADTLTRQGLTAGVVTQRLLDEKLIEDSVAEPSFTFNIPEHAILSWEETVADRPRTGRHGEG